MEGHGASLGCIGSCGEHGPASDFLSESRTGKQTTVAILGLIYPAQRAMIQCLSCQLE
ncbi:unnamed protein product [Dovyalis caffra]|uniref:Uncharacterized protein n=1 Tax=Dovyalis caffra TaxID=77055 RepID=A0AAV1RFW7_9ROSI|nr:unnamed protein product [Dovyalis caffra]